MKLSFVLAIALPLAAQTPRLSNANLQTRAVSNLRADFDAFVQAQVGPAWIGYAVPKVAGHESMCCYNGSGDGCCSGCSLEGRNSTSGQTVTTATPIQLEGPTHMLVLFRVEQHKLDKVRTFSPDCPLDGGGLTFVWLTGVQPADSIALLESIATRPEAVDSRRDRIGDGAITAIALTRGPEADAALERLAAPSQPEHVRRRTTFWLGNARGRRGYDVLTKMLREDPSDKVREQAIFGLTQSSEAGAVDTIIATARNDKSAHVRGQALFWLAQKASRQALGAISEAIDRDPETEVKRRAVFALTQLPHDEGVPKLIDVAKTNRNPEVRKQAMFWLGQSKDPRAISFFEEILTRK